MSPDQFADFRPEEKPSDEAFAKLDQMIKDLVASRTAVADAEDALKKAQENRRQLEEFTIPEYMIDTLGLEEFRNKDGLRVKVVKKIRASIGKRKAEAFQWLIDNGYDTLIKRTVQVAFNREQGDDAEALMKELEPKFAGVRQDMKVEAATLTAWVKKMLEDGKEVPHDIFGVFEQRFAEIDVK